jgi:hypothetical protein
VQRQGGSAVLKRLTPLDKKATAGCAAVTLIHYRAAAIEAAIRRSVTEEEILAAMRSWTGAAADVDAVVLETDGSG